MLLFGLIAIDVHAAGPEPNRVLVLNSFNRGYIWTDNMLRGIDDAFTNADIEIEIYIRFMDMKRIPPTPQYFQQLKEVLREGYKSIRFDAILACDNDALEFIRKYRDEIFPGVPVVFASINDFSEQMLDGRSDITGTSENTDYEGTIRVALKLRPALKNIVVVIDATTTDKAHYSAVEKIRSNFPRSITFTYLSLADRPCTNSRKNYQNCIAIMWSFSSSILWIKTEFLTRFRKAHHCLPENLLCRYL